MANHCRNIFGDMLLTEQLPSNPVSVTVLRYIEFIVQYSTGVHLSNHKLTFPYKGIGYYSP